MAGDGEGVELAGLTGEAAQLEFDFFAEFEVETLVLFQQRMQTTSDGLESTQRETFIQASQRVAARFEFSLSASASALNGFAGTAEATNAEGLLSLAEADIASISLDYRNVNEASAGGNRLLQRASFQRIDGTRGTASDAMLSFTV